MRKSNTIIALLLWALFALQSGCNGKPKPTPGNNNPSQPRDSSGAGPVETPGVAPRKLALLIGIDKYRYPNKVSNLDGCVNDVEDMRELLVNKFGFQEADVLMLKNEQATHEGIIKAFQDHLIEQSEAPGDEIIVFHYSGHGSQMKDVSGDEIGDQLDETLVCHDSRDPQKKVFDVSDDEINGLLQQLGRHTKNITFIFDSCNSGTASRGTGLVRKAPNDEREPPATAPAYAASERGLEGESDLRAPNANYVLISGCLSKQRSYEHKQDGKARGALTYFLTKELRRTGAKATYRDVMDNVMGQVNAYFPNQNPQIEGAAADHYVFSDSTGVAQAHVLVTSVRGDQVTFNAGQVHGMSKGSVFAVYAPGTKEFAPPQQALAQVRLESILPFTSTGARVSGAAVPQFARAVEREHQYAELKLAVYYHGLAQSPKLRAIKARLDSLRFVETVPAVPELREARGYHLLLRQEGSQIITEGGDVSELSLRVSVNDPQIINKVVNEVTQWAKWYNVLSINNPASVGKINLTIKILSGRGSRGMDNLGKADDTLRVGEQYQLTVANTSTQDLFISILDLSTDGSVAVLFPWQEGASELLSAGASMTTELYNATLSKSRPELKTITDVIKVIATSKPVDFHFIEQAPSRGVDDGGMRGEENQLEILLRQAALSQTRGAEPARVKLGEWATASRVYLVKE